MAPQLVGLPHAAASSLLPPLASLLLLLLPCTEDRGQQHCRRRLLYPSGPLLDRRQVHFGCRWDRARPSLPQALDWLWDRVYTLQEPTSATRPAGSYLPKASLDFGSLERFFEISFWVSSLLPFSSHTRGALHEIGAA